MIDMSIPRIGLWFMSDMTDEYDYSEPKLPDGFRFEMYKGDEEGKKHWAEILCSVGFHGGVTENGIKTFNNEFGDKIDLATKRVFFIVTDDGQYVGTCAAWQEFDRDLGRLHWLGVNPEYQKYGLGRALVEMTLHILKKELPGIPAHLATQTTSHRAICLYMKKGFYPVCYSEEDKKNYDESVKVLKGVMREPDYTKFASFMKDESKTGK